MLAVYSETSKLLSPTDGTDIYFIKNKRQPSRVFRDPILSRPDRIGSLVKSASFFLSFL